MRVFILSALLFLTSQVQAIQAKHVEVSRDAPIRKDSLSSSSIIERVNSGTLMGLLENRLFGTGYLKVTTPKGAKGYIYKSRVRVKRGALPNSFNTRSSPSPSSDNDSGNLEVHIINVGQGDAMIIRCPDGLHELLIDAAELNSGFRYLGSQTEFRNYLEAYQDKENEIEVVVATHPHSDHIAGMNWVLSTYSVGLYVDNGMPNPSSGTYKSLESKIIESRTNRKQLTDNLVPRIDFCPREDVNARILRPKGYDEPDIDPNNYSVVVRVDYGSSSFLFTGDAEKEMEDFLVSDPSTSGLIDVDFLKVGHHGSYSSTQTAFLDVVTPEIAAISCGAETVGTNKSHKHPRIESINNLLPYLEKRIGMETTLEGYNKTSKQWEQISTKAALYITNNDGDLIFQSDGNEIWRKGDK